MNERTPAAKKARQLAKLLRAERPDYAYLKQVFFHLRGELEIDVPRANHKLPLVPSDTDIQRLYQTIWASQRLQDVLIFKTLLYTGVRVKELVNIRLDDVDLSTNRIHIRSGKGGKARFVPFPATFREPLAMHIAVGRTEQRLYLFESSWKRRYSERGIHKMITTYAHKAGLSGISPHKLRHFLLLWLKRQGIDDALIQPYSGHAHRQTLEVYSRLSIQQAQTAYNAVMGRFPLDLLES